jgi:phytoene/squalene synthetase
MHQEGPADAPRGLLNLRAMVGEPLLVFLSQALDAVGDPAAFAARFASDGTLIDAAPPIDEAVDRDARDRAHLLLVRRATLVDRVFLTFDDATRCLIVDLVRDMADGMRWASATFHAQAGVLNGDEQLRTYCGHVLGNPVIFMIRLLRLERGIRMPFGPDLREHARNVGELVQLANVTRDIEKDLCRAIAYDPSLRGDLGCDHDVGAMERVRHVRERLLRSALRRAPSYASVVDAMHLPRLSLARASAVVMLLFTEQHYRRCARRVELPPWPGPSTVGSILLRGLIAAASRRFAHGEIRRVERAFLECAERPRPVP